LEILEVIVAETIFKTNVVSGSKHAEEVTGGIYLVNVVRREV
jgi:hypothetical protein